MTYLLDKRTEASVWAVNMGKLENLLYSGGESYKYTYGSIKYNNMKEEQR